MQALIAYFESGTISGNDERKTSKGRSIYPRAHTCEFFSTETICWPRSKVYIAIVDTIALIKDKRLQDGIIDSLSRIKPKSHIDTRTLAECNGWRKLGKGNNAEKKENDEFSTVDHFYLVSNTPSIGLPKLWVLVFKCGYFSPVVGHCVIDVMYVLNRVLAFLATKHDPSFSDRGCVRFKNASSSTTPGTVFSLVQTIVQRAIFWPQT